MNQAPFSAPPRRPIGAISVLLALLILPELTFQLSDHSLLGLPDLRQTAFHFGAFQSGPVTGSPALFPGQAFARFVTYMVLHTGLFHLVVNVVGLIWLWQMLCTHRTTGEALILCLISGIGAATAFAFFGPPQTMVGASGALFGLMGAYGVDSRLFWTDGTQTKMAQKMLRLIAVAAVLVLSDLVSRVAIGTSVAWQAHVGGFLTGALSAMILGPKIDQL